MSLGKFQMTANCYGGSNVVYMLILHSKCCINVPIGSRLNTWSGYIWNVPNLLLVGKWRIPSTRAYNVLKMFLLVSRPPRPQCYHVSRFCMVPTFGKGTIWKFSNNVSEMKKLAACDFEDILQVGIQFQVWNFISFTDCPLVFYTCLWQASPRTV